MSATQAAPTQTAKMTDMASLRVKPMPAGAWRHFLGWHTETDNAEAVGVATVFDAAAEMERDIFIKLYPPESGTPERPPRGLVNEVTGWLLGNAFGVPQPEKAWLVQVPLRGLGNTPKDWGKKREWLKQLKRLGVESYWAFGTAKLPGRSAAIEITRQVELDAFIQDLTSWPALKNTIALDENIANTDRHFNNLIRVGPKKYHAIDNGRLATDSSCGNWSISDLQPLKNYMNKLSHYCYKEDRPDRETASYIAAAAAMHQAAIQPITGELEYWWDRLIPDPVERQAFKNFIYTRTACITQLINIRYGLLV